MREIYSTIATTTIAINIRRPSNGSGKVKISNPPVIAKILFLNRLLPSSTSPNNRDIERNKVELNVKIKTHEIPDAKEKISEASYRGFTPEIESNCKLVSV